MSHCARCIAASFRLTTCIRLTKVSGTCGARPALFREILSYMTSPSLAIGQTKNDKTERRPAGRVKVMRGEDERDSGCAAGASRESAVPCVACHMGTGEQTRWGAQYLQNFRGHSVGDYILGNGVAKVCQESVSRLVAEE